VPCRADLSELRADSASLLVLPTEHCERILRKPRGSQSVQERDYLRVFLQQFKPFQCLTPSGLDAAVRGLKYERFKPNSVGECMHVPCAWVGEGTTGSPTPQLCSTCACVATHGPVTHRMWALALPSLECICLGLGMQACCARWTMPE
jgi:hypothetical protein